MNRHQLAHVLRSASTIADDADVVVLGSQSILGTYGEDELPPEATASQEADVAFLNDPDRKKADSVEGAIGEMSTFHDLNGYYAEGTTSTLRRCRKGGEKGTAVSGGLLVLSAALVVGADRHLVTV